MPRESPLFIAAEHSLERQKNMNKCSFFPQYFPSQAPEIFTQSCFAVHESSPASPVKVPEEPSWESRKCISRGFMHIRI